MLAPKVLRFLGCGRGNVIVTFAIMLPVLFGAGGAAIDYGKAIRIRSVEASVADATALLGANADTPLAAVEAIRLANAQLVARLGDQSATGGYTITNRWIDGSNYRVTISMNMKTTLVYLLPGMPRQITVATATTVNRVAPVYETLPPTLSQLSPEAGDYNRIYFYCFSSDPVRQSQPDKGRRGLTPIADNGTPSTTYNMSAMPVCTGDEAPSYMLRNVRDARGTPSRWNETGSNTYNYYTDTTIDTGTRIQTMRLTGANMGSGVAVDTVTYPMLETIVCSSVAQCRPRSAGGIIPDRTTNRSPAVATGSCAEGGFMYYGWEDRPGGDRDYDDIRLVVSCPKQIKVSGKKLRIVE